MAHALPVQQTALHDAYHDPAIDLGNGEIHNQEPAHSSYRSLNHLLQTALDKHCEEIHIEPDVSCHRLRYLILGSFQEIRLNQNDTLLQSLAWLQDQLPMLDEQRPCSQAWFIFPLKAVRYVFQIDQTLTSRGPSYVISRLYAHDRPIPDLNMLIPQASQFRQFRSLLQEPSGLLLLAGIEPRHLMSTLRAATQLLVSPDRKIVMAETAMHPHIPRTTQLAFSAPHTNEQQDTFLQACHLSADVIIAPNTSMPADRLMPLANSRSLLLQAVMARTAASAITELLASRVQPESIAHSLLCIVVQHRIGRICQNCHIPYKLDDDENRWVSAHSPMRENAINDWLNDRLKDRFSKGDGCELCAWTGTENVMTVLDFIHPGEPLRQSLYNRDIHQTLVLLKQFDQQADHLLSLARRGVIPLSEAMRLAPQQLPN